MSAKRSLARFHAALLVVNLLSIVVAVVAVRIVVAVPAEADRDVPGRLSP